MNQKAIKNAENAFETYAKGNKAKSARQFEKLHHKYPQSNYSGRNLYNAAAIYFEIDSLSEAKTLFKLILRSNLDDREKDSSRRIGETRTNYKHYAAFNLGKIALKQDSVKTALNFFNLSRQTYPYISDSIASVKKQEIEVDRLISECHLRQGNYENALVLTLKHALTNSPWNGHPAKERALKIIKSHFNPATILEELEQAVMDVETSTSFAQFTWRSHKVVLIPFDQTVDDLSAENLLKTSLYLDLYRHVHFN